MPQSPFKYLNNLAIPLNQSKFIFTNWLSKSNLPILYIFTIQYFPFHVDVYCFLIINKPTVKLFAYFPVVLSYQGQPPFVTSDTPDPHHLSFNCSC